MWLLLVVAVVGMDVGRLFLPQEQLLGLLRAAVAVLAGIVREHLLV
jgi:hypothetical protein